jgi:pimeloyl-ACP methyl ester carboxylesterase
MKNQAFPGQGLGVSPRDLLNSLRQNNASQARLSVAMTFVLAVSGCGGGSSGEVTHIVQTPVRVTVSEGAKTVPAGGTMEVDAAVLNDTAGRGVTWSVSCSTADCGSVSPPSSAQATYTAPATLPGGALVVTISATAIADTSKSASVMVNIAPIAITATPLTATVAVGTTLSVSATVTGDPANGGVTWSLSCGGDVCGSVSPPTTASGASTTYTAPTTLPIGDLGVTLTAVATSNSTVGTTSTITVPGFTVSVTPNAATVSTGTTAPFTATVTNDASHGGVGWTVTCDTAPCGSVSPVSTASGAPTTYTAPTTPPASDQGVTLTATSSTNSAAFGQASVTITGIDIGITVDNSTVDARSTAQVTGTVSSDTPNKSISWSVSCDTAPCGTISPTTSNNGTATTYTAPHDAPASDLAVTITATSAMNANATTNLAITVPAIGISVDPTPVLLPVNATQEFTGTVTHDPNGAGVTWTLLDQNGVVCSPACGTFTPTSSASGASTLVTAPATLPASPVAYITATSISDTTKFVGAMTTISNGTVKLVPSTLRLGTVLKGATSKPKAATVSNTGASALNVTGITIGGTNPNDFTQTNTCGNSIAAGASCTITVTFKPKSVGTRNASVMISDSSTDSPQSISLIGAGKQQIHFNAEAKAAFADSSARAVPPPTGNDAVGTRVVRLVDSGRVDPYLNNGIKRELLIRLWYPAAPQQSCRVAEYAPRPVWTYFSQLAEVSLPQVKTNSCWEAPAAPGPHPVVVFSPGYSATFTDYSYLFEDLASRGYIIASVDHTHDATAVAFPDGRLVKSLMGSHIDGTLRGDNASISFAAAVRVGDLRFVVGELARLNIEANGPFAGRMDLARVGVVGHSMGGSSAFLIAETDSRIKTTVMLDAAVPAGFVGRTGKPTMMLRGSRVWTTDECHLWNGLRGPRTAVTLADSDHVAPSDAVWLAPSAVATGDLNADEYITSVREFVSTFLDLHLRGNGEMRLSGGLLAERAGLTITEDSQTPASCRLP